MFVCMSVWPAAVQGKSNDGSIQAQGGIILLSLEKVNDPAAVAEEDTEGKVDLMKSLGSIKRPESVWTPGLTFT